MLYTVRLVKLPPAVRAFVTRDEDDHNNIYVNSQLNSIEQRKALRHELDHIEHADFDNELSIPEIEKDLDAGTPRSRS